MKRILWGCVIANVIYSFAQFTDIVTPSYIIVLLLLLFLVGSDNMIAAKILGIVTGIVGIFLSIFGFGNIVIIGSGIAMILEVIYEKMLVSNQEKYDKKLGVDVIKEKSSDVLNMNNKTTVKHNNYTVNKDIKIVNKYDIDRVKEVFDNFVSDYDRNNIFIDIKYNHSINVANNALNIARFIELDDEGTFLAYLIGILHDIGRFEQIKKYNTLKDNSEIDYAGYSCKLLEDGLIRQFIQENKYDKIIFNTIMNEDKFHIDNKLTDDEKLYCSIIRDADNLDMFRYLSEGLNKEDYDVSKSMFISSEILNKISEKHKIEPRFINNNLDEVIMKLANVYDINYNCTLKILRKNDYLNKYIVLLDITDANKVLLKKLVDSIHKDIDIKIK